MRADQVIGTYKPDNLIISSKFPVDAVGVTIKSGEGKLQRGTVVVMDTQTKKCEVLGTTTASNQNMVPFGIVCDEVDATSGDKFAMVYRSGHFNRDALILEESYQMTDKDEAALRNGGIYLDSAM